MEGSRREKIIFYAVVPIGAAVVGAVVTVIATRVFNAGDGGDAIRAVVADPTLSAEAKAKLLELINRNDQQFYDFLDKLKQTTYFVICLLLGAGFFAKR